MSHFLPSTPQLVILAALGIMIWVLWRRSNRHFGRGGKAYEPPARASRFEHDRNLALSDAPSEITRWQVELHEIVRETKGEIDTKLALLQVLIRQSHEAAARLEQATQRAERLGLGPSRDPLAAIESWRHDEPANTSQPNAQAIHPQAEEIYALADEGESAAAIAARTGLSLGDVEMTLSLRERV